MPLHVRAVTAAALVFLALGVPRAGRADQLLIPNKVFAAIDGSFSYPVIFIKEGTPDRVASFGWYPMENVHGSLIGDCFCQSFCAIQPGDSLVFQVNGQLIDPMLDGTTMNSVSLCASGDNSVQKLVLSYWTTDVGENGAPIALRLWNVPNPVSAATTLFWELPEAGAVQLRVYDLSGRAVATLVDGWRPAGRHHVAWDAKALGRSGVYYARLSVPGRTLSHAVVLRPR